MLRMSEEELASLNVIDEYKGLTTQEVRERLATKRSPMITVMQNLTHDFNKSSCVRNVNAFAGRKVVFLNRENDQIIGAPEGTKRWNKRGTVGTHHYETIEHHRYIHWRELFAGFREEGYSIYAVDNIPGHAPVSLYEEKFPAKSVFVYGEEEQGLALDLVEACDRMVYIPQQGSVRSLNVAVAHGIVSAFYSSQHPTG